MIDWLHKSDRTHVLGCPFCQSLKQTQEIQLPLLILDFLPQFFQFCPALLLSIFGYLDGTIAPGQHIPRMIRKIPQCFQVGKSCFLKHLLKGPDTDVGLNACIRVDQLECLCQLGPTFCAYSSQDSELGPVKWTLILKYLVWSELCTYWHFYNHLNVEHHSVAKKDQTWQRFCLDVKSFAAICS